VTLAAEVGRAFFPPVEAQAIERVVARDLPYYDPEISAPAVEGLNRFARATGLLDEAVPYEQIVAQPFRGLWRA
jgi:hypothetical protein